MMIVKAYADHGAWELHEAASEVRFLDRMSSIGVPITGDYVYSNDERFPWADHRRIIELNSEDLIAEVSKSDREGEFRFVRWVQWRDSNDQVRLLITDGPVYICNERGDTIESLPATLAG